MARATSSSIAATFTSEVNSGRVMPAAASSGMPRFSTIAARTASSFSDAHSSASVIAAANSATSSGSLSSSCCVVMSTSSGQAGDRRLVGVHDEVAAGADDLRHERVGHPRGVDVAGVELRLRVGEGDLDELDRRGVSAVILHGLHDRDVAGGAEAVDRDALAREVLRGRDAGVRERDDGVDVLALGERAGVVADDDDAEVLQVGADGSERLADGELDVAAQQRRDGLGAALGGHDLDLEAVLLEDALVDGAPQGAGLGDGQRGDADGA